jgi:putative membrane protein
MNALTTVAALTALSAIAMTTAARPSDPTFMGSRAEPALLPQASYQHTDSRNPTSCQPKPQGTQEAASSAAFAATATQDGVIEVALAGLALRTSHNNQVRAFAQKLAQDYALSNTELNSIVKCEGLTLPTELDAQRLALVNRLETKADSAFDKAYLEHVMRKHSRAVSLFESASKSGDPQLAAFARKAAAMLQEHQRLAENLHATIGTELASAH